ncbi:hypothetical protein D9M68_656040 [compost metagenome]
MDVIVACVLMENQQVRLLPVPHAFHPLGCDFSQLFLAVRFPFTGNNSVQLGIPGSGAGFGPCFQVIDIVLWFKLLQGLQGAKIFNLHQLTFILLYLIGIIAYAFESGGRGQDLYNHSNLLFH